MIYHANVNMFNNTTHQNPNEKDNIIINNNNDVNSYLVNKHNTLVETIDMNNYPSLLTPPMDSPESNSMLSPQGGGSPNAYNQQGLPQSYMDIDISPLQTPGHRPFLKMVEEPVDRFRFRYKSEMAGTHGSLTGRNSDRSRKQTYPTVELYNVNKPAVIRCSLYQYSREDMIHTRLPHAHRLVRKQGAEEIDDPHDLHVDVDTGYTAIFHSMGIIHTAKRFIAQELERKNKKLKLEDIARQEGACRALTKKEEQELRVSVEKESKSINLNIVCLRFDAYEVIDNIYYPLCKPIYSTSINNLKSALTGDLKIVRMDHFTSPSKGGKEIFILVEKVTKKNIKVRFYELDDDDNEIWCDYGRFTDLDVHHQYAIVFKTPAYRNVDIESEVKVFIELQRPSDGARSEPKDFTYTPSKVMHGRKRARYNTSTSFSSSNFSSDEIPLTITGLSNLNSTQYSYSQPQAQAQPILNMNPEQNPVLNSDELEEALKRDNVNSEEIDKVWRSLINGGFMQEGLYTDVTSEDLKSLQLDAPKNVDQKPKIKECNKMARYGLVSANRPLRTLNAEERKIVDKFVNELIPFIKTKPPIKRMSKMLENLFQNYNYITDNDETVLHLLIIENNQEFLPFLLELLFKYQQTSLINMRNRKRQTALHLAVESHNIQAVNRLLHTKADIALQDCQGNTALHVAVLENAPIAILKLLCMSSDASSHIDSVNYDGLTALHLAVQCNNIAATKVLSWGSANIHAEDKKNGDTVLHMAVMDSRPEIVKFLLEHTEADVERENFSQYSPIKLARALSEKDVSAASLEVMDIFADYVIKEGIVTEEVIIKEEQLDEMSDEEMQHLSLSSPNPIKEDPEDLKNKYDKIEALTPKCLEEISEILDKSGTWHNLAELLDYGHLLRNNIFTSSKNLLLFALKKGETVYEIRNFLENLDENEAVDCLDRMVREMSV